MIELLSLMLGVVWVVLASYLLLMHMKQFYFNKITPSMKESNWSLVASTSAYATVSFLFFIAYVWLIKKSDLVLIKSILAIIPTCLIILSIIPGQKIELVSKRRFLIKLPILVFFIVYLFGHLLSIYFFILLIFLPLLFIYNSLNRLAFRYYLYFCLLVVVPIFKISELEISLMFMIPATYYFFQTLNYFLVKAYVQTKLL